MSLLLRSTASFALLLLVSSVSWGAGGSVNVSATVLSKNICRFRTNTATLAFGNLDAGNPVDVTATASLTIRCLGSSPLATFFISDDDGLYETGIDANRMRHATLPAAFLPYSFSFTPVTATVPRLTDQTITVTGTVRGTDYQFAQIGAYADTVILTIVP